MGYGDAITTIALYDGRQVRHYVNGQNLEAFPDDVRDYRLLVTYNGRSFDVPFIERYFGVRLPHAHIDLRYVLARLGITGGLKRCEEQVGLARPGLEGVDGYAAVVLWHEYRDRHSERALETLLAYNVQDAVNLETLMVHAYNAHAARTPFADTHTLTARTPPALPFRPDPATVERVRRLCTRLPWAYAF